MYLISGLTKEKFWISGADVADEGRFSWYSSGTLFTFTDWAINQPDNKNGNEHCVELWADYNHQWNDNVCDALLHFICESF